MLLKLEESKQMVSTANLNLLQISLANDFWLAICNLRLANRKLKVANCKLQIATTGSIIIIIMIILASNG